MVNAGLLFGKKVVTADSYVLGEVDGIEVETDKWIVTHIRLKLSKDSVKELRFKKPLIGNVVVCLPVSAVRGIGDVISLSTDFSNIASIAECEGQQ